MNNARHQQNKPSQLRHLLISAGLLLLFFILASPACFFYQIFGLPCPGCGMTRALLAVGQGDFLRAWQLHPLIFLLPFFLLAPFFCRTRRQRAIFWTAAGLVFLLVYSLRLALYFPTREPFLFKQDALLPRIWRLLTSLCP